MEYQVVEAQPDVLEAMHSVRFAKVVRRSIHLTPFGEDFCRTCLVEEEAPGERRSPPTASRPRPTPASPRDPEIRILRYQVHRDRVPGRAVRTGLSGLRGPWRAPGAGQVAS